MSAFCNPVLGALHTMRSAVVPSLLCKTVGWYTPRGFKVLRPHMLPDVPPGVGYMPQGCSQIAPATLHILRTWQGCCA